MFHALRRGVLIIRYLLRTEIIVSIAPTYSRVLDTDLNGAEKMVLASGHEAAGLLEHALQHRKIY